MAGGTGSRFWPLCDPDHAKQFIDLMGTGETMLQSTFRHYSTVCAKENIIIVTTDSMKEYVAKQLPGLKPYQVLCEPQRRNTAPCIAYAAAIIRDINPHANVVVAPSDHAIFGEKEFRQNLGNAIDIVDQHEWIVTLGAQPTNPNTKYGYLQFNLAPAVDSLKELHKVITFTEKPPVEMAAQFISSGEFLWNSGIFVWNLSTLQNALDNYLPQLAKVFGDVHFDTPQHRIRNIYQSIDPISIDYGIMEKAENVYCLKASFGWSDVETWDSLYNVLPKDSSGNAAAGNETLFYNSRGTLVHLPANKTAVVNELNDYLVVEHDNVLLICPRGNEDLLIKFASELAVKEMAGDSLRQLTKFE